MIKNGEFCIYNDNEYELNEDSDGNLIIITTNRAIIDETFVDKYNSGVYSKVILPNEIGEAYDCQTYGVIKGSRTPLRKSRPRSSSKRWPGSWWNTILSSPLRSAAVLSRWMPESVPGGRPPGGWPACWPPAPTAWCRCSAASRRY